MKRLFQLAFLSLTCIQITIASAVTTLSTSPGTKAGMGIMEARQHHYQAAIKDLKQAAQAGSIVAHYSLGVLYANGEGVPENYSKAVNYYRYAAKYGYAFAMVNLGDLYRSIGKTSLSIKWYLNAKYSGNASAMGRASCHLGQIYYANSHYKNNKKAIKHFRDAASLHYIPALYYLGLMNFYGQATPKNYQRAYNLFMIAKHYGVAGAQQGLNRIYFVLTIPQIKQLQKGKFNMSELIKRH